MVVNVFQAKILESTEELQRSMLTYAITISDASSKITRFSNSILTNDGE